MAIRVWLPALLLAFLLAASPFTQGNNSAGGLHLTPLSLPATQIRSGDLPPFGNSAPWQR